MWVLWILLRRPWPIQARVGRLKYLGNGKTIGRKSGGKFPVSLRRRVIMQGVGSPYLPTGEGWPYLASLLDAHSRRGISWAMADHLRTELALDALTCAPHTPPQRGPGAPHRSRLPIHCGGVSGPARCVRQHLLDEPGGRVPG